MGDLHYYSAFSNKLSSTLQVLGSDPADEGPAAVPDQGRRQRHLERVPGAGRRLSRQHRLQIVGTGPGSDQGGRRRQPESLVFRCRGRPRVLSDEERLLLALSAVRHVQGVPERDEEEGKIHTEFVWCEEELLDY